MIVFFWVVLSASITVITKKSIDRIILIKEMRIRREQISDLKEQLGREKDRADRLQEELDRERAKNNQKFKP